MPATQVPKSKDFMEWYNEVVEVAELTDKRYGIKGMNVWRPYGWAIMCRIDEFTRAEMARTGHQEVSFPLMIPEKAFLREADQIKGFGSEVFWVTHAGENELPEGDRWVVRPTSECAMYEVFPLWIRSHTDLPLQTFQICNVFRYETKQTRAFMRVREIHFFEDHSVFADEASARAHVGTDLEIVRNVYRKIALPALYSKRPDWDKFPGAVDSIGADVVMPSGRTLQCATVHYYGENFAKAYKMAFEDAIAAYMTRFSEANPGITVENELVTLPIPDEYRLKASKAHSTTDLSRPAFYNALVLNANGGRALLYDGPDEWMEYAVGTHNPNSVQRLPLGQLGFTHEDNEPIGTDAENIKVNVLGLQVVVPRLRDHRYCHQTTYGMSERLVGAVVGCHGDDNGLILAPEIAPVQVVIVPILFKEGAEAVIDTCTQVKERLGKVVYGGRPLKVELDAREKSPGDKYYHWELRGVPLRLEIGPKDVAKQSVFAARRDMGKEGKKAIPLANLEEGVVEVLSAIQASLFAKQQAFRDSRIKHPKTLAEAQALDAEAQKGPVGYVFAMPICGTECAAAVEKGLDIKTLGVPVDESYKPAPCAVCGKTAKDTLRFARTY